MNSSPRISVPSPLSLMVAGAFAGTIRQLVLAEQTAAISDELGSVTPKKWWILGDRPSDSPPVRRWLGESRRLVSPRFGGRPWGAYPDDFYRTVEKELSASDPRAWNCISDAWVLAFGTIRRQFAYLSQGRIRSDTVVPVIPRISLEAVRQAVKLALPPLPTEVTTVVDRCLDQALDVLAGDPGGPTPPRRALTDLMLSTILGLTVSNIDSPHGSFVIHPEFVMTAELPEIRYYDGSGHQTEKKPGSFGQPVSSRWSDGWELFGVGGIPLSAEFVLHPESVSVEQIRGETDVEVRNAMIEAYKSDEPVSGAARFILDAGAEVIDEDERFGTLLCHVLPDGETILVIKMRSASAAADGSFPIRYCRVEPECRPRLKPMGHYGDPQPLTARAAMASTLGLRAEDFDPQIWT